MSHTFQAELTDEPFIAEILSLLDVDEGCWPKSTAPNEPLSEPPQPKLRRLCPRANSDTVIKPKRIRKETAPRVRNKAKIELLRHEIKGLEAVLASLQNSQRRIAILERRRANALWRIIAMKQSHERQLAEHRNVGLKRMLEQQYTLTRSLTHVLEKCRDLPEVDVPCGQGSAVVRI